MSYLAQEMMGFGKPSPIVEKILNGTDKIVHIKQELPNPRKCSNCGNTAQPRLIDVDYSEDSQSIIYRLATYKCGCGHMWLTSTTYQSKEDEEIIDDNI